jgi:pyruvate,water dikinase
MGLLEWFRKADREALPAGDAGLGERYLHFRRILNWNNECLERLAQLQEDLSFVSPRGGSLDESVDALFERTGNIVTELDALSRISHRRLAERLQEFRREVDLYLEELRAAPAGRLGASLDELDAACEPEAGGKAAVLGEIRRRLGLRVPEGFVITTEAHRRFCEQPNWVLVRDRLRRLEEGGSRDVAAVSAQLSALVECAPLPPAIRAAIEARAAIVGAGGFLAVRSSAWGEAGSHNHAGQFLTLLNVPAAGAVDAYRRVVASRYSERALGYRLALGIAEVDCPLAVLFMRMVPARAAGILYTRNPSEPRRNEMWVLATPGLGSDLAAGGEPADFIAVSRNRPYRILRAAAARKQSLIRAEPGGGVARVPLDARESSTLSLEEEHLRTLAGWALAIEDHFRAPQDIEWALDGEDRLWILQARRLEVARSGPRARLARPPGEPVLEGGSTIHPGRVSGKAWLVDADHPLRDAPRGSIVFLRKASPEVAQVLSRVDGLVAEWGNVGGHAAALLREFQVPSLFLLHGAFDVLRNGDPVSLDAAGRRLYHGAFWPGRERTGLLRGDDRQPTDPLHRRVLALNLLDPTGAGFREKSCASLHDVLRFCHEKAVEAMFSCHDAVSRTGAACCRQLVTSLPLNVLVLDLGGGLDAAAGPGSTITPQAIASRPFQAIWQGFVHPGVKWTRDMPISFSDLTSVLAGSLSTNNYVTRALGEKSYLMVAPDYFNLNARLAFHFTLIDACLTDTPASNYVSFRFAGGGAARGRRNLRACFIEACLTDIGFQVDRRGDLVNGWLKNLEPGLLAERLDVLGRLTACTCQLDMYMDSRETMEWYVRQFREGNYSLEPPPEGADT